MSRPTFDKQLEREKKRNEILAKMVEDKTRELFLEHEELRKTNEYLDRILSTMVAAVIVTDSDLNIVKLNSAAASLLGQTFDDLYGQSLSQIFPIPEVLKIATVGQNGDIGQIQEEYIFQRKSDERRIPVYVSMVSVRDNNGNFEGLIFVVFDISARKELEQQLLQAQKLQAIGQLSAGIAHEINTPMQFIRDNLSFVRREYEGLQPLVASYREFKEKYKEGSVPHELINKISEMEGRLDLDYSFPEVQAALGQSLEGADVVSKIVRSMKEFSHPGAEEKQFTDINKAIESTATVSRNEWKYVSEMKLKLAPALPLVPCFAGELNQVILNLIVNAAHTISDVKNAGKVGLGTITIATSAKEESVEIRVADTGMGIPERFRSKVFDPFFTTKGVGKGTGQGLALAYMTVVDKHKGSLSFETQENEGTTFIIELPLK